MKILDIGSLGLKVTVPLWRIQFCCVMVATDGKAQTALLHLRKS